MTKENSFLQRLNSVQKELKAPKGQRNTFGKFNYRSAEDILEAVKPINHIHGLSLKLSDEIVVVGERVYVKATCTLEDVQGESDPIVVTAFAREPLSKKGMDDSQITGTASSYARKYALNGLYLIDDTKDADTNEQRVESNKRAEKAQEREQNDFTKNVNELVDRVKKLATQSGQKPSGVNNIILERVSKETGNKESKITKSNISIYNKHLRLAETRFQKNQREKETEQTSLMQGNTTQTINWEE